MRTEKEPKDAGCCLGEPAFELTSAWRDDKQRVWKPPLGHGRRRSGIREAMHLQRLLLLEHNFRALMFLEHLSRRS